MRVALPAALARLLARAYRVYYSTLRVTVHLPDGTTRALDQVPHEGRVFVLLERDVLALAGWPGCRGSTILVARGRDGDWVAEALGAIGYRVVRGSSRHEPAAALSELVQTTRAARAATVIVADGPIGPSGRVERGAFYCAMKSGRGLVGVSASAAHALVFRRTWSRMYLPWPFTRVTLRISGERCVAGAGDIEAARRAMEAWFAA